MGRTHFETGGQPFVAVSDAFDSQMLPPFDIPILTEAKAEYEKLQ